MLTGTSSSPPIFSAALAHALSAMPEISVNVVYGGQAADPASGRGGPRALGLTSSTLLLASFFIFYAFSEDFHAVL